LLNTLFVTSEDIYLSLDGENVVANRGKQIVARYPLHTIQSIVTFAYLGASTALMGACADRNIGLAFCTPRGRFLARVSGENNGNVILRRAQYRIADDPERSCQIARNMIFGKLYNSKWSIERTCRDHAMRVDVQKLHEASAAIGGLMVDVAEATQVDHLRGLEGVAATEYFGVFDDMILGNKEVFCFDTRNRRPPLDPVNAMLSFAYSLLSHDCASGLESVGLDAYVGFLHCDRPGRASLSLDLMEELRPCMADRFVLTLINNRRVKESDFLKQDSGAVILTDSGRKQFLSAWQEKKREQLKHPYLGEKMEWGMIPYVQALLLARHIRGDLDAYPPFLWK
jgi:CRISPR-associated protein Cas1